ncbi:hypothetical protein M422DRAFT_191264 [Sphaerobolus stellatus SS14]|uniref:Phospholipase D/nuclease n=1 Tax=Sphaerobolus stellatus (strain SS14) TaxID=990650 RepID=A0A0C9TZK8_SPHS4|nr:hypothetical protein M422DRAFT_191264 [Sphaerobolus stellatus SS14]
MDEEESSPAKISRVSELDSKNVSKPKDKSQSLFWNGELRQTSNLHVDPRKDAKPIFSLPSILGDTSDLDFAILSSYSTPEPSWVYSFFPPSVPVILVGQPSEDGTSSIKYLFPNWVRVAPFLRYGRGAMHIKLLLLFYKSGRLRLSIPTANFAEWDWKDIENSVWLQDIPKFPSPIPHDRKAEDFPALLVRTLDALHHPSIPISSIQDIRSNWNFSNVTAHLIPSLAGRHETWPSVLRVGHIRLMRVVRLMGARADPKEFPGKKKNITSVGERQLDLECQGSSIGSYTPAWIDEFYTSAKGASPEGWLNEGKTRRVKRLDLLFAREGWGPWRNIKILFPSLKTVTASVLGTERAGMMFCTRRQWDMPKFPRALFHDANSKRGEVLMHSKMILTTFPHSITPSEPSSPGSLTSTPNHPQEPPSDPERNPSILGWLYVGSHNFTPSAWGTLSGTAFTPSLDITNYELGVIIPLTKPTQVDEMTCWERPPRKYGKGDEPWVS